MRHQVKSKRVNRGEAHLNSMLKNLITSIILYEKVKTTKAKAKIAVPIIEKLLVSVKNNTAIENYRNLNAYLADQNASKKIMQELLKRYKDRNAGFTRMTNLGFRAGDAAPMVQIELV
jgi:large subunit ribosomal protein L17